MEQCGLTFHTTEQGTPYWDESVYYEFSPAQVDCIEQATYALNAMCLEAVEHVIHNKLWDEFRIPQNLGPWISQSWETEERTIIGRFDLAYTGEGTPRLLEYNADTPTSLLEAAVIQWQWYRERFADDSKIDQFNAIHERLIEAWSQLQEEYQTLPILTFLTMESMDEDDITTTYLRDTAVQAGWLTEQLDMAKLGYDAGSNNFVGSYNRPVDVAFKLYPWEWMVRESFGKYLTLNRTRWLEPPWKMILSNKALLPMLWKLFPGSPYLLEASWEPLACDYVRKPIFGREGNNVTMMKGGVAIAETRTEYDDGPAVYQALAELTPIGGYHTVVIGSWMVNGYAAGMGLREDSSLILGNLARFVPHIIQS